MKLSAKAVVELAQLRANIAALQKEEKQLTGELKKAMQKEKLAEFIPEDCPYKLQLNEFDRSSVNWKAEWKKLAKQVYGSTWQRIETKLLSKSKKPSSQLCVEPNENFKAA